MNTEPNVRSYQMRFIHNTALRQRHGEPAFRAIMRGFYPTVRRRAHHEPVKRKFLLKIDPRRLALFAPVHDGQILAAAQLVSRPPQQDNHIAFILETRSNWFWALGSGLWAFTLNPEP